MFAVAWSGELAQYARIRGRYRSGGGMAGKRSGAQTSGLGKREGHRSTRGPWRQNEDEAG
jgi:hypothetical protein